MLFLPAYTVRQAGLAALAEIIRRDLFDLVVVDTTDKVLGLEDENSNSEIANVIGPIIDATHKSKTAVLLVHHHRKSGGEGGEEVRGGSALLGAVDVYLSFKGVKGKPRAREISVYSRFEALDQPLRAVLSDVRWGMYSVEDSPKERNTRDELLELLESQPGLTIPEIAEALGRSRDAIRSALRRREKAGHIKRDGDKFYLSTGG